MVPKITWFQRQFIFGLSVGMLPFFLERLEGTFARLQEKTRFFSEETLSGKLDRKWSVKENIAHLAEVGKISDQRITEIIEGAAVMSPAMFPLTTDYDVRPIAEILELFRTVWEKSIARYVHVQESDLLKKSLHPRLKVDMTAVDLAWFDAEHDDHHLVRINEILSQAKKHKV